MAKRMENDLGFWVNALPDTISNSPYCLSCNWENLVLDQFIIPKLKIFFILITCLLDIVLILKGEIQEIQEEHIVICSNLKLAIHENKPST